jgi:hypothetical protein
MHVTRECMLLLKWCVPDPTQVVSKGKTTQQVPQLPADAEHERPPRAGLVLRHPRRHPGRRHRLGLLPRWIPRNGRTCRLLQLHFLP